MPERASRSVTLNRLTDDADPDFALRRPAGEQDGHRVPLQDLQRLPGQRVLDAEHQARRDASQQGTRPSLAIRSASKQSLRMISRAASTFAPASATRSCTAWKSRMRIAV